MEDEELEKRLRKYYSKDLIVLDFLEKNKITKAVILKAAKSRMKTLTDFKSLISEENQRLKTKEERELSLKLLKALGEDLGNNNWKNENFLAALKKFSKNENTPFKIIYFLLTGKEQGIGLLELNQIYGNEFFIKNLTS
jgi:lysyl-tRNA synthetase class I